MYFNDDVNNDPDVLSEYMCQFLIGNVFLYDKLEVGDKVAIQYVSIPHR